jgi:outer membrane receptor for monomeric catechols
MLARRNPAEGAFSAAGLAAGLAVGAHVDSVNLRGLSIPDSFFLDGMHDIGQYQRDTIIP